MTRLSTEFCASGYAARKKNVRFRFSNLFHKRWPKVVRGTRRFSYDLTGNFVLLYFFSVYFLVFLHLSYWGLSSDHGLDFRR